MKPLRIQQSQLIWLMAFQFPICSNYSFLFMSTKIAQKITPPPPSVQVFFPLPTQYPAQTREDVNSARNQLRTCRHVRCHIRRSESKWRRGRRPESLHGRPAALRQSDSASLLSIQCGESGARGAAERFEASRAV